MIMEYGQRDWYRLGERWNISKQFRVEKLLTGTNVINFTLCRDLKMAIG